jgi:hypothetical protein
VNRRLPEVMVDAYARVAALATEQGVDLHAAALMVAVCRIARAMALRGLDPKPPGSRIRPGSRRRSRRARPWSLLPTSCWR